MSKRNLKLWSKGHLDGHKIEIIGMHKWGNTWVYKVKFTGSIPNNSINWIEYLTAKMIGSYQGPY